METFRIGAPGPADAAAVCQPVGSPVLVSSRLTNTGDGRRVVDDRAIVPGVRVVISAARCAHETDVRR